MWQSALLLLYHKTFQVLGLPYWLDETSISKYRMGSLISVNFSTRYMWHNFPNPKQHLGPKRVRVSKRRQRFLCRFPRQVNLIIYLELWQGEEIPFRPWSWCARLILMIFISWLRLNTYLLCVCVMCRLILGHRRRGSRWRHHSEEFYEEEACGWACSWSQQVPQGCNCCESMTLFIYQRTHQKR